MKISELIHKLHQMQVLHGDIDVVYDCDGYHIVDVKEVTVNTTDEESTVQIS